MNCNETNLSLYLYGELLAPERDALEAHIAACKGCQASLEQTRRLHSLLGERPSIEPAPDLLVKCREALGASLDREQFGWRRLFSDALAAIANPSRVAAALTLVVFGFGLGWMLRQRAGAMRQNASPARRVDSSVTSPDLGIIGSISQISQDPQTDKVSITVNSEHRVTLEGSLDDPRIRQILVDAVKTYSNAGIRLDTLDALKQKTDNPSVEDALLYALRHDPNAGVRLEALRSVPAMSWDAKVQDSLVQAVQQDENPGVRVAAIDDLVKHAVTEHDQTLVPILRNFARNDSNTYVRVKAMAAVRELGQGN
jgi:HEAT repeat protein